MKKNTSQAPKGIDHTPDPLPADALPADALPADPVIASTDLNLNIPLAERLRPDRVELVIGQRHLLGEGKALRVALDTGRAHSMILWGPPGAGKTTLARLMADAFDLAFLPISATLGGVKDIRDAVQQAQTLKAQGKGAFVFVDEVHRFNKSQQDAFLPYVESGLFFFCGATTENVSFAINSALLSRAAVYRLEPLTEQDLEEIIERGLQELKFDADSGSRDLLAEWADGDARRLLNGLEICVANARAAGDSALTRAACQNALSSVSRRFDKAGDSFYDQISALHKSVRGSDPDASLYWLCRMLDGGADPVYLSRRLIRMANEDIGLADPKAARVALDASDIYERLGSPEGELALAQAVVYLAAAPKSNAIYKAYNEARAAIAKSGTKPVPNRLRNAPTRLMAEMGHGRAYRYAHDEPNAYAAGESYWPDEMTPQRWYRPTSRGVEKNILARLQWLRSLDEAARSGSGSSPKAAPSENGPDSD